MNAVVMFAVFCFVSVCSQLLFLRLLTDSGGLQQFYFCIVMSLFIIYLKLFNYLFTFYFLVDTNLLNTYMENVNNLTNWLEVARIRIKTTETQIGTINDNYADAIDLKLKIATKELIAVEKKLIKVEEDRAPSESLKTRVADLQIALDSVRGKLKLSMEEANKFKGLTHAALSNNSALATKVATGLLNTMFDIHSTSFSLSLLLSFHYSRKYE